MGTGTKVWVVIHSIEMENHTTVVGVFSTLARARAALVTAAQTWLEVDKPSDTVWTSYPERLEIEEHTLDALD